MVTMSERARLLNPESQPVRVGHTFVVFEHEKPIPAGATVNIAAQPYTLFRPLRISISPSCAESFNLMDIRVGKYTTMVTYNDGASCELFPPKPGDVKPDNEAAKKFFKEEGLPADLFPPLLRTKTQWARYKGFGDMLFPSCEPDCLMVMIVRNKGTVARPFSGILWGAFVES